MFYRAIDGGFYEPSIHGGMMPEDVVEISDSLYFELLKGQEQGKQIEPDRQGFPKLVDPPALTVAQLSNQERIWRDAELAATDPVVARHRDELEEGSATTLTEGQYVELQTYRRALRSWPEADGFPLIEHRPLKPAWLTTQFE
ncbi:phage tail assembly chaperone [Pseudomonas kielensis]|uniref:phage tail assembly chaperone n=1 Tax=Pseudomonas kielensis TaxID=2762577 RepID=UPI0038A625DE